MEQQINRVEMGERFKEALDIINMQQNKVAEVVDTTSSGINSYTKGRAIPRADVMLKLMKHFKQVNWYYVIFGSGYGSIQSDMPIIKEPRERETIENLQEQLEHLRQIIKLQEESIKDKERLIKALSTQNL